MDIISQCFANVNILKKKNGIFVKNFPRRCHNLHFFTLAYVSRWLYRSKSSLSRITNIPTVRFCEQKNSLTFLAFYRKMQSKKCGI